MGPGKRRMGSKGCLSIITQRREGDEQMGKER